MWVSLALLLPCYLALVALGMQQLKQKLRSVPLRSGGRSWTKLFAIALPMMLLTACATAPSDNACPPLIQYDEAFKQRAAKELSSLPPGSAIATMVVDYSRTRDLLRHCQ